MRTEDPKEDPITKESKNILKRTLKEGGVIVGVLRYWKDVSVGAEYIIFQIETLFTLIHF